MFEIAGGILVANVLEIVAGLAFFVIFVPICFAIGYTKQKRKEAEQRERFIKYKERMDRGEKLTPMEQLDWDLFHDRYID
jgi:glucan phosphorylase